jgi:hypothetical protein
MSRWRWIVATVALLALLVGIEVSMRLWARPKACVQVTNQGESAIEDLVVVYGSTRMPAGRLTQGKSVQVWLTAGPPGPLSLEYRQKGNAIQGFQIDGYDPAQNIKDSFKTVLEIGTNQVQRYVEDDETRKESEESLGKRLLRWLESDEETPKK